MTIGNISTVTSSSAYNQRSDNQGPDWYKHLWQASRLGKLDETKTIINNFKITPESSPRHFEQCFMVAGREGRKDIIDYFLSLNALKAISLKSLTYALDPGQEDFASEDNRKEIIDSVFNKLDKDPSFLYKVFKSALANNHIKVVKAITKFIDPEHIHEALRSILIENSIESEGSTTSRGYAELIEVTINSLSPEQHLSEVFPIVALNCTNKLLSMNINHISSECLCKILHLALEQNHEEIENVINSKKVLRSDRYGEAFVHAVKNSQIDVIQLFLKSSRFKALEPEYSNKALWHAARRNMLDEFKSIKKDLDINLENFPGEFSTYFMVAAREGHKDIINYFISLDVLEIIELKQLVHGLNSGLDQDPVLESHKEIVDIVMNSIKYEVLKAALIKGHIKIEDPDLYKVLKAALANGSIKVKEAPCLYKVFKAALANDCIKVVKAITKLIRPTDLYEALKSILEKNSITSEYYMTDRNLTGLSNDYTTNRNYADLIEATINSLSPEQHLSEVFPIVALNCTNKLLSINHISSECLCKILHLALEQNHEEIENVINSEKVLRSDRYGEVFVHAAKNSQIDVIQLFLKSSRFKTLESEYLDQALASSNPEIEQMIKLSDRFGKLNITAF